MAYQVIALRYRPRRFCEVVGQEEIAQTLKRAVCEGRLAHAYLFAGPRGVGKTSMARILAMALNCSEPQEGEPCGRCDSCRHIAAGSDLDVIELDGASHRGIDDVREIAASAACAPLRGKVKVYIVDEVHMLTREAFNAFLKTLEEPPPHVKFVLATTEPQRIPETVASRLQRFDFRPISEADVVRRLRQICSAEGIRPQEGVLLRIAQYGRGGMRDAQTLLDQLIAYAGSEVSLEELDRVAGRLDEVRLRKLCEALERGNVAELYRGVREALSGATTPEGLLEQFLLSTRREVAECVERTGRVPEELLLRAEILAETIARLRTSPFPEIVAEVTLLRLCSCRELATIGELLQTVRSEGGRVPAGKDSAGKSSPPASSAKGAPAGPAGGVRGDQPPQRPAGKETSPRERSESDTAQRGSGQGRKKADAEALSERVRGLWNTVVSEVRKKSMRVGEFLRTATPRTVTDRGIVVVEVAGETVLRALRAEKALSMVTGTLCELLGTTVTLHFERSSQAEPQCRGTQQQGIEHHPLLKKAQELFRGEP